MSDPAIRLNAALEGRYDTANLVFSSNLTGVR